MVSVIADILKSKLEALDWIERFSGMVAEAKRPVFVYGENRQQIVTGYESFPVACDVNTLNCWENGVYKILEPDSTKAAIAFFVDNGGTALQAVEGPKLNFMRISFDLKFLCWMNLQRLGSDLTNNSCYASGRLVPYVISELFGTHTAADVEAVFGAGSVEADTFQAVEVTGWQQLTRNPSMFAPFTFAANNELFIWPYDYFGLRLTGFFVVNRNCLPTLYTPPFVPDTDECLPVEAPELSRITDTNHARVTNENEYRTIAES